MRRCFYHEKAYISRYEALQKNCCDPFKVYKKKIIKGLCKVNTLTASQLKIKPGQKLCTNCLNEFKLEQIIGKFSQEDEDKDVDDEEFSSSDLNKTVLNKSASLLEISPLKNVSKRDKLECGKQKVKKLETSMTNLVASALDIDPKKIISEKKQKCINCNDLDKLLDAIKEKVKISLNEKKVQLLTLTPDSWSIKKTCNAFSVSDHLVKKARKLKNEKGILAKPEAKKGHPLEDIVKQRVIEIYESDEYTRQCPGKKDFVSVRINNVKVHKQKRLILVRLKEIHLEFKKLYPEHKVGFNKFCELRPKWCLTVDSSGSHSVCVCSYHQNAKLMCSALPNSHLIYYKDLMKVCVCNIDSRNCMFHLCSNCPGKINLKTYLENVFEKNDFDFDDQITYKQWVSTDRTALITVQTSISEFIETLSETLYNLCHHHFIKEAQSSYLSETKQTLDQYTCIILMDFAENYSFLV